MEGLTALDGGKTGGGAQTTVRVISAAPLKENQISMLCDLLCGKLKKQVKILPETDPSLIGGLMIHVEGRIIERTIRRQLHDLKDGIKRRKTG